MNDTTIHPTVQGWCSNNWHQPSWSKTTIADYDCKRCATKYQDWTKIPPCPFWNQCSAFRIFFVGAVHLQWQDGTPYKMRQHRVLCMMFFIFFQPPSGIRHVYIHSSTSTFEVLVYLQVLSGYINHSCRGYTQPSNLLGLKPWLYHGYTHLSLAPAQPCWADAREACNSQLRRGVASGKAVRDGHLGLPSDLESS